MIYLMQDILLKVVTVKMSISSALLLCLILVVIDAHEQPSPVTTKTLHQVAASLPMYVDKLPQLPRLLGFSPGTTPADFRPGRLTIGMYQTKWKFHRDLRATTVFAYGTSAATATVPGPLIESIRGTPTYVTWQNYLPHQHILPFDTTITLAKPKNGGVPAVVHLHGGIHPPQSDGNPFAWFTAGYQDVGSKWSQSTYMYPNIQRAGNLWYHDHALGLTRVNLLAGLFGPYVINDPEMESKLNLPNGPEFDRHLMVFDRSFYKDGSLYINSTGDNPRIHPQWQPEYFGDAIIVNGKAWPFLLVERRKYRFRIINTSNARYFRFSLTNGLYFTVIGSDSSYLSSPVKTSTVFLAPSEISDVVIDFSLAKSDESESELTNDAPYPYPSGDPTDNLNSKVMKFVIKPDPPFLPDFSSIPFKLTSNPVASIPNPQVKRYIVLYEYDSPTGDPTHLFINGKSLLDPVTETPEIGSTEVWEVINLTPDNHPLHIHLAQFTAIKIQKLVDLDGFKSCMEIKNDAVACNVSKHVTGDLVSIPEYEKTWKNVVKMEDGYQTTVLVKFNLIESGDADADTDPYPFDATAEPGYVYHCHILDHEDNEMIRPLKLVN